MIRYESGNQQVIPDSEVIIVGVGGAGTNVLDRVSIDGMEDAKLLALNTDVRTLKRAVGSEHLQLGKKLTRGLGCGGDPELGLKAAQEAQDEIRAALSGYKMVFICVGLGGGTSSGAAPLVTQIAREQDAFVVVFATMPFVFEGDRRRTQAETALNQISSMASALITFDNGRMGSLVMAEQGIHEAFAAADNMISESIRAVTRLVIKPGLINVGLDDLMSSLNATRSRCLFGSGLANGDDRCTKALENALNSPLLDKGKLLKDTQTALVHVCGGNGMTFYETELLMKQLSKSLPDKAQVLFGVAVDETMGEDLSVTIISSLPEEKVEVKTFDDDEGAPEPEEAKKPEAASDTAVKPAVAALVGQTQLRSSDEPEPGQEAETAAGDEPEEVEAKEQTTKENNAESEAMADEQGAESEQPAESEQAAPEEMLEQVPAAEKEEHVGSNMESETSEEIEDETDMPEAEAERLEREVSAENLQDEVQAPEAGLATDDKSEASMYAVRNVPQDEAPAEPEPSPETVPEPQPAVVVQPKYSPPSSGVRRRKEPVEDLQTELFATPSVSQKGVFKDSAPNIVDGEDRDVPTFLRRKH